MFDSPISVLYNQNGSEIALSASQSIAVASQPGLMIMGSGSNGTAQFFKLASDGSLLVSGAFTVAGTSTVSMSNSPTVNQGTATTVGNGWYVRVTDGTQVLGTGSSAPLWITGSVTTNVATVATQSVYVGGWTTGVTASVFVGGWTVGVTASTSVAQWANNVTASVREVGASQTTVSATVAANGLVGFTLLSANASRKGGIFYLDGNRIAYIKLGTGADTNTFSYKMTNQAYWELPSNYTGPISCTFASGSAAATLYVTDILL